MGKLIVKIILWVVAGFVVVWIVNAIINALKGIKPPSAGDVSSKIVKTISSAVNGQDGPGSNDANNGGGLAGGLGATVGGGAIGFLNSGLNAAFGGVYNEVGTAWDWWFPKTTTVTHHILPDSLQTDTTASTQTDSGSWTLSEVGALAGAAESFFL